jgi:hypothetical protein
MLLNPRNPLPSVRCSAHSAAETVSFLASSINRLLTFLSIVRVGGEVSTQVQQHFQHLRIADIKAYQWFWSNAPSYWRGKVDLEIRFIDFNLLEPANTLKHWDVLATWTRQISCRRQIPPLIVSQTPRETYYIHDGNHRAAALRICFRKHLKRLRVGVAVAKPREGYRFQWREFSTHGTYQLVPIEIEIKPGSPVSENDPADPEPLNFPDEIVLVREFSNLGSKPNG